MLSGINKLIPNKINMRASDEPSSPPVCQELYRPDGRQQWHVNFKALQTVLTVTPKPLNRAKRTQKSRDPSSGPVPNRPKCKRPKRQGWTVGTISTRLDL